MSYFYTSEPQNAWPGKSFASPKTHVPGSPVKERGLRFYSPEVGRWCSRDPIEEAGGKNVYASVCNNGLNKVDILGLLNSDTDKTWNSDLSVDMTWASPDPPPPGHTGVKTIKLNTTVRVHVSSSSPGSDTWTVTTDVTLDRGGVPKNEWNDAIGNTGSYDVPIDPTTGWKYPNFLQPMIKGIAGDQVNDFGVVWVMNKREHPANPSYVNDNWNRGEWWALDANGNSLRPTMPATQRIEVNKIHSRKVDVPVHGCPADGFLKIWVFYADYKYMNNKSWGIFKVPWKVAGVSGSGSISLEDIVLTGDTSKNDRYDWGH